MEKGGGAANLSELADMGMGMLSCLSRTYCTSTAKRYQSPRPHCYILHINNLTAASGVISIMQSRAAIPPTLPRANPTMSYWQEEPDEIANLQSTNNVPGTADIVIIGSGISGASIAYDLLSRDATTSEIVMFEARQACSGATGRNGRGFTFTEFWWFFDLC